MNKRFKPQYLPHNDDAHALVDALAVELGLTLKSITGAKHKTILASFLYCVQEAGVGAYLDWSGGTTSQDTTGFSFFPATGAPTVRTVRTKLVDASYVTLFDNLPSGIGAMTNKEAVECMGSGSSNGRLKNIGSFRINSKPLLDDPRLETALFLDAQRPYVMVNKPEKYTERVERKAANIKAPKLSWDEVYKGKQKRRATAAARSVMEMNAYWAKHPLTLPATNTDRAQLFSCATRIFHDGSLISGGRWYGGWTNLKSDKRLHMRIDDEPICEIDLNGSQPTLFSALLGIRMNVGETWTDVYVSVVERLDADEEETLLRKMVKQVIVEMLGSGNCNRNGPASTKPPKNPDEPQLFFDTDHSKRMYLQIQREALEVFPALKQLDAKYYNATGFLSYHESEILTLTLLRLKELGVPAYGVHDCVVVKQSDKDKAVKTYRSVIRDYVVKHQRENNHPILNIKVSLTIEELGMDKVKLAGCYDTMK
eukprot:GHVU01051695.1.p1 GENE.GHVU01051695.1~~GHVU01051695.1.p1  ORF type:complete len:482 (+),score=38.69 GHVU01051695.1:656-2101(+)